MAARSIAFLLLLGMSIASGVAAEPPPPPPPPAPASTAPATAPSVISLPSFGLSVPLPDGYVRDVDSDRSAVMIVPAGRVGKPQERVIMINVMPRTGGRSFERSVEEVIRGSAGLRVVRNDALWGGLKATELSEFGPAMAAPVAPPSPTPVPQRPTTAATAPAVPRALRTPSTTQVASATAPSAADPAPSAALSPTQFPGAAPPPPAAPGTRSPFAPRGGVGERTGVRLPTPTPTPSPAPAQRSPTVSAGGGAIDPSKPRTLRSLMLERDDYLFLLGLVGTGEGEGALVAEDVAAFEAIAAGTQWVKLERAGDAIAARTPPLVLSSAGITFMIPDPFRPDAARSKNTAVFVARDLPMRVIAARLTITGMPKPAAGQPPRTLGDLKVEIDRTMAPQWRLKEPLKWGNAIGEIQTTLSQPVDTPEGWMQAMLVLTPDGRATVFALQCRGEIKESGRMDQVLRIIRRSIGPAQ